MGSLVAVSARMTPIRAAAVVAVAIALVAPAATGQRSERKAKRAQKLVRDGLEAYAAKDYDGAAQAFEKAYELDPDEQTLFAWAQAERFRGDCKRALELFQKLLDTGLSSQNRTAVRTSMTECSRAVTDDPGPPPDASDPPATGPPDAGASPAESAVAAPEPSGDAAEPAIAAVEGDASAEPPLEAAGAGDPASAGAPPIMSDADDDSPRWYQNSVGRVICGTGLVGISLGIGLFVSARSADRDAGAATQYEDFVTATESARLRGNLAVVSMAAGVALVGGGVAWSLWRTGRANRARREDRARVSVWQHRSSIGLTVSGSF